MAKRPNGIRNIVIVLILLGVVYYFFSTGGNPFQFGAERITLDFCSTVDQCKTVARENGATEAEIEASNIQCSNGVCTATATKGEAEV